MKLAGINLVEGLHPRQQTDTFSPCHKLDLKPVGQKSPPLDGGSRLARGSAADLDSLNQGAGISKGLGRISQQDSIRQDSSSSKRKRVGSSSDAQHQIEYAHRGEGLRKCRSRDQMPPPPIPMPQVQPFVTRAEVPSSDLHGLVSQYNHINPTLFQRAPITPHQRPSERVLSRSMLAPGASMEPSSVSSAEARTNYRHLHVDHHQSPHAITDTTRPVYTRGGWQPQTDSFDTERSGYYSSPSSSLPSTGQPPRHRSIGDHQGSLSFPIEMGDRTIDPSSHSYQSVSSDGSSSYYGRQSAFAMRSQLESPVPSCNHSPLPNKEGRITLPRTPSLAYQHSLDKGIGLSSHIRSSSSRHANHQSANSSSHRQQLVIANPAHQRLSASAHFPARQPAHSVSLPCQSGLQPEASRRNKSFDCGPTPVNGEMRPYSTNDAKLLRAYESRVAPSRGRAALVELQALGPRRQANR